MQTHGLLSTKELVLPKPISCFDKPVLSEPEAERTVHPSTGSGQMVGLGNSPSKAAPVAFTTFDHAIDPLAI